MAARRGALIVLEGVDRSGKSTQAKGLVQYIKERLGLEAELLRYPDRTTATGKVINEYLSSTANLDDNAIHLLFAANRWEAKPEVAEKLQRGINLVVDRYSFSGVAYSAAKGLSLEWCKHCEDGLIRPDVVIQLEIEAEVAAKRGEFGKERYEKLAFQKSVADTFKAFQSLPYWKVVDATLPMEKVEEGVQSLAAAAIKRAEEGEPLLQLW
uniref:Thymidylate kinase n=1 Tax=Palpitomonas bilix TaxID=652834 RepID=A0A7S3D9T9_9EUKA